MINYFEAAKIPEKQEFPKSEIRKFFESLANVLVIYLALPIYVTLCLPIILPFGWVFFYALCKDSYLDSVNK